MIGTEAPEPTLSVVIVTYNAAGELSRTLPRLVPELREGDELIVADNGSADGTLAVLREQMPAARVVQMGGNAGFPAACNAGAAAARGELLVILNPDAAPEPGFGAAIRRPWTEERGWAAWQGLVATGDGAQINSAGNPIHFTCISWAGGHGRPLAEAPPPGEVPGLSGACLAIPRATWESLGGFPDSFFLYHDDVDLSLRLRLQGGALGIEPAAVVHHDYDFFGREHKWRWLERNRWACLIRTYPGALIALLLPALLATELALIPISVAGGWWRQKARAWLEVLGMLPRLLRERREIQAARRVGAAELAAWLTPDIDSSLIGPAARAWPVRLALRSYWRCVRLALGLPGAASSPGGSGGRGSR